MSVALNSSQNYVDQLTTQASELKTECDQLHHTLEEVDQWIATRMRRRIWESAPWKSNLNRSKERSVAYARSLSANATSKISRAAGNFSGSVSTAKSQMGLRLQQSRPMRLLNRSYCTMLGLIGMINKKGNAPQSCAINTR